MSQAQLTGAPTIAATRRRTFEPLLLLWIALAVALLFLVVNPLFRLVQLSLQDPDTGAFTLANYAAAYGRERYLAAMWNSLSLGFWVTVLCLIFAVPLAWAVARTDMPAKGAVRLLVLGAFVTPPYLGSIAWILLAGPNSGWLNRVWMALTGADHGLFNIYSFPGLVFNIAIYSFPYIFIFTSAALDVVSSEMEDAANILGAGTLRTTFRITLPMVLPAILAGAIVTFLEAIALFGTPALIAIPARFNVVTTQLLQFFGQPIRAEVAAAYAVPLLLITVADVRLAAADHPPPRLHRAHRQGRRPSHHRTRPVALGHVRLRHVRAVAVGHAALHRAGPGGIVKSVGQGAEPGAI